MKRKMLSMAVAAVCICMMAGCNKTAKVEEPIEFEDEEEFIDEYDEFDEYPEEEYDEDEPAAGKDETEVADGSYLTDETYSGYITDNGDMIVITTALNHENENWETVLDYKKQEYRFPVSSDCKCVVFTEDREENPVTERIEFINEFLKGNSGLPINLKIENGKVEEIGFSS
ncbi:MAG: hypothetical protein J5367_00040 [Lachnospiraceae bacterium]|nr:hypothetical protein [Lachnospiraceae bacterium]